jgi:hypothetical protein
MNFNTNKLKPKRRKPEPGLSGGNSFRGTILLVVLLAAVGLIFVGLKRLGRSKPAKPELQNVEVRVPSSDNTVVEPLRSRAANATTASPVVTQLTAAASAAQSQTLVQARQLIEKMTQLDLTGGSLTREGAGVWKQSLQQLVQHGAGAVPAISEFLKRNVDLDFRSIPGGELLGYGSLRVGLFDALQKIGGAEAIDVSRDTLKTTADPLEVAMLTRGLEQQAPGQYREEELNAAREVLTQAIKGQLTERSDVAPLFELLQAYGDETVVPLLVKAAQSWRHYATFALAGLHNGVGIPALLELAQDPQLRTTGTGDSVLVPLAQVVTQYPQAAAALVEQAQSNAIPPTAWPSVAKALAGTPTEYGKRIFGRTGSQPSLTNEEISRRVAVIDQMLAANSSSDAAQPLQQARAALTAKLH